MSSLAEPGGRGLRRPRPASSSTVKCETPRNTMHKPRALTNRKVERLRKEADANAKGRLQFKLIIALHLVVAGIAGIGYTVHNVRIRERQFQDHLQHHHHFGIPATFDQTNPPLSMTVNPTLLQPLSLLALTNTSGAKPVHGF